MKREDAVRYIFTGVQARGAWPCPWARGGRVNEGFITFDLSYGTRAQHIHGYVHAHAHVHVHVHVHAHVNMSHAMCSMCMCMLITCPCT